MWTAHISFDCPNTDNTNRWRKIREVKVGTCVPRFPNFQRVDKNKCDVNLGFLDESAALLYPWQHEMSPALCCFPVTTFQICESLVCRFSARRLELIQGMPNGADERNPRLCLFWSADTGWWSQRTVTWWRADRSPVWCWCLWPARKVLFVWTARTWKSCDSPSNSWTAPSPTAGFTSGFSF